MSIRVNRVAQDLANRQAANEPDPNLRLGRPNGERRHQIVSEPPDCAACPLRHKRKVLPDGPVPAQIAIVGEEPGKNEEREGRGFVGVSGEILWKHLGPRVGIERDQVWVTNALLCRSENVQLASGAFLPKAEVQKLASKCCRRRLLSELAVVDPAVVIPVGKIALQSITQRPRAGIYAYRGSIQEADLLERYHDFITLGE
jgi:uracil-DNA glycosylase family 4